MTYDAVRDPLVWVVERNRKLEIGALSWTHSPLREASEEGNKRPVIPSHLFNRVFNTPARQRWGKAAQFPMDLDPRLVPWVEQTCFSRWMISESTGVSAGILG
jgi:hypothetical protein